MNISFHGNQDLIRSVEEGSRLLLSEKKNIRKGFYDFPLGMGFGKCRKFHRKKVRHLYDPLSGAGSIFPPF